MRARKRIEWPHQTKFLHVFPHQTRVCFWSYVFLQEENVSCLSRLAGSPKSRGGRVAQPTSGSVEADSPHLHQTAALFWHGSENWPWWSLMSGGMWKNWSCSTLCCSFVHLQFADLRNILAHFRQQANCKDRSSCHLELNLNLERLPKILERWHRIFVYPLICLYLLLPTEVYVCNGMPKHTWRMCAQI